MTDSAPKLVIDCTVHELEPAVYDATGVCIKPPVLSMPSVTEVPLTADEIAQRQTDRDAHAKAEQIAAATALAGAWIQLRMIRDRWLAQTDYIEVFLSGGFSPLPQAIQDALTANKTGWESWRQALRDLPATSNLDPLAAVSAAGHIHSTADTFGAPWPQPPSAPTIHLT